MDGHLGRQTSFVFLCCCTTRSVIISTVFMDNLPFKKWQTDNTLGVQGPASPCPLMCARDKRYLQRTFLLKIVFHNWICQK